MFCKNCGSPLELEGSAQFCSNCGFSLGTKATEKATFVNKPLKISSTSYKSTESKMSELKSHIQIIAVFEIVIGTILLVGSFIIFAVRRYAINNVTLQDMESVNGFNFGMNLLLGIGLLVFLYALFTLVSGIGLLKYKKWSKFTSLVVGALSVFSFPLGTIFGVFTLYSLTKPEASEILVN